MQTTTQTEAPKCVVVAGIDLSDGSREVLEIAATRAALPGGELHAVHVIPSSSVGSLQGDSAIRFSNMNDEVCAKLKEMATTLPASAGSTALHVRLGNPDVEIAQLAFDVGADLVVVGTHGHSGLERLVLGSVGESLIRNAPCPVLVCRPKSVRLWEQIQPSCADCLAMQKSSGRKTFWCERHAQHHPRAHTYSEVPPTFGMGSQTFR